MIAPRLRNSSVTELESELTGPDLEDRSLTFAHLEEAKRKGMNEEMISRWVEGMQSGESELDDFYNWLEEGADSPWEDDL